MSDVVQDDRLIGVYPDQRQKDMAIAIAASEEEEGKYDVRVVDGDAWISYRGTLFKIGEIHFLDLYPLKDSGIRNAGGVPTATEILHAVTFLPLHMVMRVSLAEDSLSYATMDQRGIFNLLRLEPGLRGSTREGALLLQGSTTELKALLLKHSSNDQVFNLKAVLKKDPTR